MGLTFIDGPRKRRKGNAAKAECERASEFAAKRLGFAADERQAAVLDSGAGRGILLCTRQWGKSTVAAAKAIHRMWTRAGTLVLVSSPTARQSAELVGKAEEFARRLGERVRGDGRNEMSLRLRNGSRMVGLPGNEATVRGFSAVDLVLVDEAARVPDAMYKALRPMLAVKNGDLWLMSTPNGQQGFFYEEWVNGGSKWERVRVPATECGRIPEEFLAEEERTMDSAWFRQEYLCEFVGGATDGWFSQWAVERALCDGPALRISPRICTDLHGFRE